VTVTISSLLGSGEQHKAKTQIGRVGAARYQNTLPYVVVLRLPSLASIGRRAVPGVNEGAGGWRWIGSPLGSPARYPYTLLVNCVQASVSLWCDSGSRRKQEKGEGQ
jgi:hypothetical protein